MSEEPEEPVSGTVQAWHDIIHLFGEDMGLAPEYREDEIATALYRLPAEPTPFNVSFFVDQEGDDDREYVLEGTITALEDYGGVLESSAHMYQAIVEEIDNKYIHAVEDGGEGEGTLDIASIQVPTDYDEDDLRHLAEDAFWILLQVHGETINALERVATSLEDEDVPVDEGTAYRTLKTELERAHVEARHEIYPSFVVGDN